MPKRQRLDKELVDQGFFSTTDDALRAVLAGDVSTSDRRLTSPGEQVVLGLKMGVKGGAAHVRGLDDLRNGDPGVALPGQQLGECAENGFPGLSLPSVHGASVHFPGSVLYRTGPEN